MDAIGRGSHGTRPERGWRSDGRRGSRVAVALFAVVAMGAAGCTGEADPSTDPTGDAATVSPTSAADDATPTPAPTGDATTPAITEAATTPPNSVIGGATTPPGTATAGDDLPGDEFSLFWQDGDILGVIGVAHNDVLNVRAIPGTSGEVVATAAPTADDLEATGRARRLSRSIWLEVAVGGVTGWVNSSFTAYIGGTDDATADYRAMGRREVARNMRRLGRVVARGFASTDAEVSSDIVRVVAPSHGDLSEVTYDVVGLADDSVLGFRLHVFAEKRASRPGFRLRTIERTVLCGRGLSGELCS